MKLAINIDTEEYTINEPNPNDKWDHGNYGLIINGVNVELTDKEYGYDLPEDCKIAVVLVEHYSDGCTFGSSEYAEVKGVFVHQADAEAFAACQDTNHGYFGSHIAWLYFEVAIPERSVFLGEVDKYRGACYKCGIVGTCDCHG